MAYNFKQRPTPEMNDLLRRTGDNNYQIAMAAMAELAKALTLPLKQGVLKGDIIGNIFENVFFEPGASVEFPLDFLSPGTEKDFVAYTIPNVGRIPEKSVEGDFLMVPTYDVGASIDWPLKYAKQARWDVVGRAMQVLEASHIRKDNGDGWHVLLAAAVARNIVAYDNAATSGLFTKRLVALMRTLMRRNAGGNSTSLNKGKLTDLYISPEAVEDIRSWDLTQIDEFTRKEIFDAGGDDTTPALMKIFGALIHDIDEFGVGQEFQTYYQTTLGGTMPSDKVEVVIGLDLFNNDSFVRPVRQELEMFEDQIFHRQNRGGLYSRAEGGWAALDGRRVLAAAL